MTDLDPSAQRDATAKTTATTRSEKAIAEIEAIHVRLSSLEDGQSVMKTAAEETQKLLKANTEITEEVLGYVKNGKLASGIVKWVVSVAASVVAILGYFKGHG